MVPKEISTNPKRAFISALSSSILWEIAKRIFGYYIYHSSMINKIYGTYAIMLIVIFWIYYSSLTFIIGAEIGQLYRERKLEDDEGEVEIVK